jgi:hypothetical protein
MSATREGSDPRPAPGVPGAVTRRDALKCAAAFLGYAVSGATLAAVLDGRTASAQANWSPQFFTADQAALLSEMVEHLLPKTSTPGARDVGVDRFIDSIMNEYFSPADQRAFTTGLDGFDADCRQTTGASFVTATPAARDEMFKKYEAASPALEPSIWGGQTSANPPAPTFYRQFKELTLVGYFTSEAVGKHILDYDPIPGRFDGCVPMGNTKASVL